MNKMALEVLRLLTLQMWVSKGEYEEFGSSSTGSAFRISDKAL